MPEASVVAITGRPIAVHPLVVGYEPIAHAGSVHGGDPAQFLLEPVTAVAVEYVDGWILLDTGFNLTIARDPALRAQWTNFESYVAVLPPGDPLWDGVARSGLARDGLRACAISHAHLDHTGGVPALASGVPVLVQRREWDWVAGGAPDGVAVIGPDLLSAADRVVLLDGDTEIAAGLTALATPGHTPGHQSFLVELSSGRQVLFAFDAADLRQNIDQRLPCGWTVGEDGLRRSQESVDRLADYEADGVEVWPGHDPGWAPWQAVARGESVVLR